MPILSHILAFIVTLSIIIIIHEYGHYLAARFFRIPVRSISLGFGKILWESSRGEENKEKIALKNNNPEKTNIQIRVLLIGGFVQLDLTTKYPIWQRLIVVLAGPFISLVFGMFIFWLALQIGIETMRPEIAIISPNTPAAIAQMQPGEEIIEINNNKVTHWGEVFLYLIKDIDKKGEIEIVTINKTQYTVQNKSQVRRKSEDNKSNKSNKFNKSNNANKPDKTITVSKEAVQQETSEVTRTYYLQYDISKLEYQDNPIERLGIIPIKPDKSSNMDVSEYLYTYKLAAYDALIYVFKFSYLLVYMTFLVFYKLIVGILPLSMLTGPLGMAIISKQALLAGLAYYLYLIGTLSIHFAAINMLPIPGLDGAEVWYSFIEKIRGKMFSPAMQELLRNFAIAILIALTGLVLSYDVERFFGIS